MNDQLKHTRWLWLLLPLLLVLSAYFTCGRGIIHPEAKSFLLNYLSDRSILAKVFDPASNDWGCYQARELSYFFDLIDAYFIDFTIRRGTPLFFPLSQLIGLVLIVLTYSRFVRHVFPAIKLRTNVLLLSLLLSTPSFFMSSVCYFRSAKILTAAGFFALACFIYEKATVVPERARSAWAGAGIGALVFLLATGVSLLDRQGFFLVAATAAILGMLWLDSAANNTGRRRSLGVLFAGAGAAVVFMLIYNPWLGPWIIRQINGYDANFTYQRLDYKLFLENPESVGYGFRLFLDQCSFFMGNISPLLAAVVAERGIWLMTRNSTRTVKWAHYLGILVIPFMYCLMNIKGDFHAEDLRRTYYWLSTAAVLFFWTILAAHQVVATCGVRGERWLDYCLGILLLGNLLALPQHINYVYKGHLSGEFSQSAHMLVVLKQIGESGLPVDPVVADPTLDAKSQRVLAHYRQAR